MSTEPPLFGVLAQPRDPVEVRYETRNDAFSPACTWILQGPWLRREVSGQPPVVMQLSDLRSIRLEFAPTRPERNRYLCKLTLQAGASYTFFNRTYRGVYDFPETNQEYVAFLTALHAALQRYHAQIQCLAGPGSLSFWLQAAWVGIAFVALAWILLLTGMWQGVVLQLFFIAFYTPTLLRWFKRNRHSTYRLHAPPGDLLPEVEARSGG